MSNIKKKVKTKTGIVGEITAVLRDKHGKVKRLFNVNWLGKMMIKYLGIDLKIPFLFGYWDSKMVIKNLVTNTGFAGVASRINGAGSEAAFTYLGVGIGTTGAAAGDTTLESEIVDSGLARASATASRVTTAQTNDTAQLSKTFSVTGTKAVTECGALNAASNGVLLGRQVFSAINVVNGDSLQMTYKFQVSTT